MVLNRINRPFKLVGLILVPHFGPRDSTLESYSLQILKYLRVYE